MERSYATDTASSFILGGLVGAGLALLFAPRAGSELRSLIGTKVREGASRGRELGERAAQKSRTLIDDARHGLDWQKERLNAAVEAGREAYHEEKS
jgi:gas vesicle protein